MKYIINFNISIFASNLDYFPSKRSQTWIINEHKRFSALNNHTNFCIFDSFVSSLEKCFQEFSQKNNINFVCSSTSFKIKQANDSVELYGTNNHGTNKLAPTKLMLFFCENSWKHFSKEETKLSKMQKFV